MRYIAVYDDRIALPDEIREQIGVPTYGGLLHRKRLLREQQLELLGGMGFDRVEVLRTAADLAALAHRIESTGTDPMVAYLPASAVTPDSQAARSFLGKLRYATEGYALAGHGGATSPPPLFASWEALRPLLNAAAAESWGETLADGLDGFKPIPNHGDMLDLGDREAVTDFLSSTFDVRHFNAISHSELVVTKRSRDKAKMRAEAAVFDLLEGPIKAFFLPPIDAADEGETYRYATERLAVPDMAIQWLHRALDPAAFDAFLERVFAYVALRPTREGDATRREALYLGKVEQRHRQLREHASWPRIERLLVDHAGIDLAQLAQRHAQRWRTEAAAAGELREAISHGDLCFSNILYERHSRLTKLIDPRGATELEGLYLDATYDLAKLSHSVLGLYDFVNHGLHELRMNRDLDLELDLGGGDLGELQALFTARIEAAGLPLRWVRACEASLFLSMLPLHVDVPRKVVAFALIARRILDDLDA